MRITLLRSYPKLEDGRRKLDRDGNPIIVFVYRVNGTKEELIAYEEAQRAQGVDTVKDEHGHLYFTVNPVGKTGTLKISPNGKIYADTTALDLANALIKRYGVLGQLQARDILNEGFTSQDTIAEPAKSPEDLD